MPRDMDERPTENHVGIDHKVKWEVRKPMTRLALSEVLETCEEAVIPDHAILNIINWVNQEGFTVEARWSSRV